MSGQKPLVVVIDDEQGILDVVSRFAQRAGYETIACSSGRDAVAQLQTRRADLVMVDLRMPDLGGLDVLRAIREIDPRCQAVLMTGYASVETAVEAIKLGATDYLSKPLDFARLEQLLATVRDDLERRRHLLSIESDVARRLEFCGMIGRGPVMQELFAMIRRLAPHVRAVLVTGETGTGKELVARGLHHLGPRRDRRFVTVNCSAVVETLFESELFGHVRGAFTGATEHKQGLFELADHGTLFLDEIGELSPAVQAKLLRVLELGEVHRVGSLEPPALRDRREDIPYLTAAFVRETSERLHKPLAGLTPSAERMLSAAAWDGNVRELRNVIERACIMADGDVITERELSVSMPLVAYAPSPQATAAPAPAAAQRPDDLLVTVEREHIQRALVRANGNKKAAARMLGLSRRALYRRLERLDLGGTIMRRRDAALEAVGV